MNQLFKDDILDVNIDVKGETSNYTVRISFAGILDELHKFVEVKNDKTVNLRIISKALSRAYNNNQTYVRCSCPDWYWRHGYWATKNGFIVGQPETRPPGSATKPGGQPANPNDNLGGVCKHVALALTDASWLVKVASVIHNYIRYMQDNQEQLYMDYIYPALYMEPYPEDEEGTQTSMFDKKELAGMDDRDELSAANQAAVERTRFKKGNKYRFQKQKVETDDGEQMELSIEPEVTRDVDEIPEREF